MELLTIFTFTRQFGDSDSDSHRKIERQWREETQWASVNSMSKV